MRWHGWETCLDNWENGTKANPASERVVRLEPLQIVARALTSQAFEQLQAAEALPWWQPLAEIPDGPVNTVFHFQRAYPQRKGTMPAA